MPARQRESPQASRSEACSAGAPARPQLETEKRRSAQLAEEVKRTKEQSLAVQKQVEQEEGEHGGRRGRAGRPAARPLAARHPTVHAAAHPPCCRFCCAAEYITNKLLQRLAELKKEKQTLANEVEAEEGGCAPGALGSRPPCSPPRLRLAAPQLRRLARVAA